MNNTLILVSIWIYMVTEILMLSKHSWQKLIVSGSESCPLTLQTAQLEEFHVFYTECDERLQFKSWTASVNLASLDSLQLIFERTSCCITTSICKSWNWRSHIRHRSRIWPTCWNRIELQHRRIIRTHCQIGDIRIPRCVWWQTFGYQIANRSICWTSESDYHPIAFGASKCADCRQTEQIATFRNFDF